MLILKKPVLAAVLLLGSGFGGVQAASIHPAALRTEYLLSCTVPPNTTAEVRIPAERLEAVTERGRPLTTAKGVTFVKMSDGRAVCEVSSGTYEFEGETESVKARWMGGRH